jgi:hypothetical protein
MEEVERSLEPESRGLGRGDNINATAVLYPLILTFSRREKGRSIYMAATQIHVQYVAVAGIVLPYMTLQIILSMFMRQQ